MIARSLNFILIALLGLATLTSAGLAAEITFTGQATYRERIALPPDAQLQITLVTLPDAHPIVKAISNVPVPGQVPLHFTLDVHSQLIADGGQFGLLAEIHTRGRTLFRNAQPVPVDVTAPLPVQIVMNFSPEPSPQPSGETTRPVEPSNALFETVWIAQTIAGTAVLDATEISFSIAPDHRAGGNGGCNSYFTEAKFEGKTLHFGPVAGTLMACDSKVMQQEHQFFAALAATASYDLNAETLTLLDADGKPLAYLSRQ